MKETDQLKMLSESITALEEGDFERGGDDYPDRSERNLAEPGTGIQEVI